MSVLEVKNLKFGYLDEILLNGVDFRLLNEDHIGLVGANGCGKSTFMNLIAHRLIPDSGEIVWDKNISFSYLDQHLKVDNDVTIADYLYKVYENLYDKEEEMNNLYTSLESASVDKYDKILNKAYNIQEYLENNNFYMIKSKISNVINGLGIDSDGKRKLRDLSSGQRGKVFLGKMLLEESDVLLLDEPTNFLDVKHVEWLTKFLVDYKHPFIVISHNTDFLNGICNVICSLENKTIKRYKGNYDAFLKLREEYLKEYEANYESQQKYIKKTEEFIQKNIVRASTTKRAQSRQKELDKVVRLEKPTSEKKVIFNFPFTNSFNLNPLETKKLVIGYDKPLLAPINITIAYGEKIVITGANGVGKSTFLKTILGLIKPISGSIKLASFNKILYYEQEYKGKMEITPLEYFKELYPLVLDSKIRTILGKVGITGDLAIKPLKELSGGELTKVRFARLMQEASNLLILDEPTNHLDKIAKQALFKAISEYPGTVMIVSHEKEFYKNLKMKEINFSKV